MFYKHLSNTLPEPPISDLCGPDPIDWRFLPLTGGFLPSTGRAHIFADHQFPTGKIHVI